MTDSTSKKIESIDHFDFIKILEDFLSYKYEKGLEIEIRIGTIIDKKTKDRLSICSLHPIIMQDIKPTDNVRFENGVSAHTFERICKKFAEIECKTSSDRSIIYDGKRYIHDDGNLAGQVSKIRVGDIFIYMPDLEYDARFTITTEGYVPFKKCQNADEAIERERERKTYVFDDFNVDFTKIVLYAPDEKPVKEGEKRDRKITRRYEIEIEANRENFDKTLFINSFINIMK